MQCPRCQHDNPAGQKFCGECGSRLASACPSCGGINPPAQKFCGECGTALGQDALAARFGSPESYTPKHLAEKILTSKAAIEGERKQVTVLFADLKGSMELLADRDPEEARKLLDPVLERMMEAVHRYEGTVNQVMGDGIMALFGAPIAHEDHAVRACHAALRMQEAVKGYAEEVIRSKGVSAQIRIGLNSGDVVVRAIGSDLHMDYTAVGQTTHLAARMEQLAPPGSIYATAAVLRLSEGYVTARSIGPTPVKGLPGTVEIWEITATGPAGPRFETVGSVTLTPFVGRDEVMSQLTTALGWAQRGEGQLVAVVGEAGVGKSRLFWEFLHRDVISTWTVLRGHSVSYGKATPYLPIVDLLKRGFQIGETATPAVIATRIREALVALDAALEPDVPALLAVLGVPSDDRQWEQLDPPQRRERVLEALRRLLLRLALDRPVLLIVEDLHWIDDGTQEVLDTLVDAVPTSRILLLVNYRPEYGHGWAGKSFYTQVRLDPLPADASSDFLDCLLGADATLVDLKRDLVERTQGNPFFLEEGVRHLVETGVLAGAPGVYRIARSGVRIEVPVTVQGVLAARIDRLSPDDKRLLQAAAVVGKDVPLRVLEAVTETRGSELRRALARLQGVELLREVRAFPESLYTFKHALTHEVTYGTLLGDRKKALHGAVLNAMERLYAERLTEHAEALAHHANAGEVWEKAVDYLREAGAKAYTRGTLGAAVARTEEALDIGNRLPQSPENMRRAIDVRLALHPPLFVRGELARLLELHTDAEQIARQLGDQPRLGRVLQRLAVYSWVNAAYSRATEYARNALEIGTRISDLRLRVMSNYVLAEIHQATGSYRAAIDLFLGNIEEPEATAARDLLGFTFPPYVGSLGFLAWCHGYLGDFDVAAAFGERAVQVADELDHPQAQVTASMLHALPLIEQGKFVQARPWCERGVELGKKNGSAWLGAAYSGLGLVLARSGNVRDGLSCLERGATFQETVKMNYHLPLFYLNWAEGWRIAGEPQNAKRTADRALQLAVAVGERGNEARALHALGQISASAEQPDVESARNLLECAMALAGDLGMRPLVAHCEASLANLYRRANESKKAQAHFTTATTMYREMDMQFWLKQAEAEMS
jgi:class 3 adenylate cyclase/tetratricopeptide (TPR) repeat protein